MTPDWSPLRKCLAACRAAAMPVPFWWRDDDAVAATSSLDRLEALSESIGIPVHVAVIPARAETSLAAHSGWSGRFVPVVHGWRHTNHAPDRAKKSEFGAVTDARVREIEDGLALLRRLFPENLLALFVPPWNRIDPAFHPVLEATGYRGLSTFGPRDGQDPEDGLVRINTHLDPINWRGGRDLIEPATLIERLVGILQQRLEGTADPTEPLGYLTHHLVHTGQVWEFSRQVLTELLEGGATAQAIAPLLEKPV